MHLGVAFSLLVSILIHCIVILYLMYEIHVDV